jgi:phosphate transport system permease protein
MSSEPGSTATLAPPATTVVEAKQSRRPKRHGASPLTTLSAHGAPLVWLTGGALAMAIFMIVGLLVLVVYQGLQTFWPTFVVQLTIDSGAGTTTMLGEISRTEKYKPTAAFLDELKAKSPDLFAKADTEITANGGYLKRSLIWTGRTGTLDFSGSRAAWVNQFAITAEERPEWAMVFERMDGGRSYGTPSEFVVEGKSVASTPDDIWKDYNEYHGEVMSRVNRSVALDRHDRGAIDRRQRAARLAVVSGQLDLQDVERNRPDDSKRLQQAAEVVALREKEKEAIDKQAAEEKDAISAETQKLAAENARYVLKFTTAGGEQIELPLADIVRAYPANRLTVFGKLGVYLSRWWEFLSADPRESNTEGGVFPAIWGTVAMTLIMSVLVVPFGVLAALYLREYAKAGPIISAIRISINNLAGVPSIVFGVFGLGLFCYVIGASIDQLFFKAALAEGTPTFGTGGIMWASFTLALLTLPVVIVATEESLAAVPNSMREGSYACGASKWQTIWRIVLPRALPGIMTGTILAMARGAGEVAPLILVGVKDMAPALPIDGVFPFVHPDRSFMHLAYQIYIVGFKSPNAEAAKPMVFTTTLLLIAIVAFLNIAAVYLRTRLRRRFVLTQF